MSVLSAIYLSRIPILGFIAIGLFWGAFASAVPYIKANLGVSDAVFGLAMLMNAAGLVVAMFYAPRMDRVMGQRGLQISAVLFAAVMPLPVLAPHIGVFVVVMALIGFGSGLLDVLINTRVSELEGAHHRPLMNASHGMFSVAYAVVALCMGAVRGQGGDPIYVFLCASAIVLIFAFGMRMIPSGGAETQKPRQGRRWVVYICGAIVLVAFMTEATVETWSALHIERTLLGNPAQGALGPAMLGFTMAFGRLGGQAILERFADVPVLIVATLIAVCGCTMAALAPSTVWAYWGFGVLGLGISVIGPTALGMVGKAVEISARSSAIAAASIIGFSGFFVAPAVMGVVSESFGLRAAYLVFSGLLVLLFPLIWAAAHRVKG
ncbi:MAG: MFS transporter [Planktomarina sp.]